MFTGIILTMGAISAVQMLGGDNRLTISAGKLSLEDCAIGDSIAVNGVCLTVVKLGESFFCADVSNETLSRTTLKSIRIGSKVNLEPALTASGKLGGHFVSGHVDGIGRVVGRDTDGRSVRYKFKAPDFLAKYIAEKGSICINGVSLTVNEVDGSVFSVNIVPHTLRETTLGDMDVGTEVNLEADLLARYLERLINVDHEALNGNGVTETLLHNSGFLK